MGPAAPLVALGRHPVSAARGRRYSTRAIDLVRSTLVIDMLAPLTSEGVPPAAGRLTPTRIAEYRATGVTGWNNAAALNGGTDPHGAALISLAAWNGFAGCNSDLFTLVSTVEDLERAKFERKIAVIQGFQSADHYRSASDVGLFQKLGLRSARIVREGRRPMDQGSLENAADRLTTCTAQIVEAMNATGMLVDISRCSDRMASETIGDSTRPVAITHGDCRAITGHAAHVSDDVIRKLARKGGVIGVGPVSGTPHPQDPAAIERMVDHIEHVVRLVGVEHVGIGSNLGPTQAITRSPAPPDLSHHPSRLDREGPSDDAPQSSGRAYDLAESMIRRGYSDADIASVLGGSFLRLLSAAWGEPDSCGEARRH